MTSSLLCELLGGRRALVGYPHQPYTDTQSFADGFLILSFPFCSPLFTGFRATHIITLLFISRETAYSVPSLPPAGLPTFCPISIYLNDYATKMKSLYTITPPLHSTPPFAPSISLIPRQPTPKGLKMHTTILQRLRTTLLRLQTHSAKAVRTRFLPYLSSREQHPSPSGNSLGGIPPSIQSASLLPLHSH